MTEQQPTPETAAPAPEEVHTPGPMTLIHGGVENRDPSEPWSDFDKIYWLFKAGAGFCGYPESGPEFQGFGFTGAMTPADAKRIKLCWDSHDALLATLKELLGQVNNIEVLGEYSAMDINLKAQRRMRESLDITTARCCAAIASAESREVV